MGSVPGANRMAMEGLVGLNALPICHFTEPVFSTLDCCRPVSTLTGKVCVSSGLIVDLHRAAAQTTNRIKGLFSAFSQTPQDTRNLVFSVGILNILARLPFQQPLLRSLHYMSLCLA